MKRANLWSVPDSVLADERINSAIRNGLPENYNFEVHKTIWRIRSLKARKIALQLPEGLLIFATILSQIFKTFGVDPDEDFYDITVFVFGDVTYGACCVDDFSARALGVDLLVHYGHSCLVPVNSVSILYVFVDIQFDLDHFIKSVTENFKKDETIGLVGTIQFVASLQSSKKFLESQGFKIIIPQSLPLSPGEMLGCTSPKMKGVDVILYLGDGRFHLESAMISNPYLKAIRYDPYSKKLTEEKYDHKTMRINRRKAVETAKKAEKFGLILGTLGRQGSPTVLQKLRESIIQQGKKVFVVMLSEIFPSKLELFGDKVDAWIQVACPRLSIDWGTEFSKPLLTPYEAFVALNLAKPWQMDSNSNENGSELENYPMDYYAYDSLGPWTPNNVLTRPKLPKKQPKEKCTTEAMKETEQCGNKSVCQCADF